MVVNNNDDITTTTTKTTKIIIIVVFAELQCLKKVEKKLTGKRIKLEKETEKNCCYSVVALFLKSVAVFYFYFNSADYRFAETHFFAFLFYQSQTDCHNDCLHLQAVVIGQSIEPLMMMMMITGWSVHQNTDDFRSERNNSDNDKNNFWLSAPCTGKLSENERKSVTKQHNQSFEHYRPLKSVKAHN